MTRNIEDEAELIADNIECATQRRWASEDERSTAVMNIRAGLERQLTAKDAQLSALKTAIDKMRADVAVLENSLRAEFNACEATITLLREKERQFTESVTAKDAEIKRLRAACANAVEKLMTERYVGGTIKHLKSALAATAGGEGGVDVISQARQDDERLRRAARRTGRHLQRTRRWETEYGPVYADGPADNHRARHAGRGVAKR